MNKRGDGNCEFEFMSVDSSGRLEFFPSFVDRFGKGGDCGGK